MIYSIFLCRNLDYVQIPESLTYIEKGTFDDCGFWVNLTDIKGYTGSYAQTFAKNNNLKLICKFALFYIYYINYYIY